MTTDNPQRSVNDASAPLHATRAVGRLDAPELETTRIIDARNGPQDHACSGVWQLAGLNAGGHEIYACDSGKHSMIGPHVAADHECAGGCDHAFTLEQARAAMRQVGREIPAVMEAAENDGRDLGDSAGELERIRAARAARGMSDPLNVLRAYNAAHASEAITAVETAPELDASGPGGRLDYWAHITGEPSRYGNARVIALTPGELPAFLDAVESGEFGKLPDPQAE